MSWNQGQAGASNGPTAPRYKGMVKVLPTPGMSTSPRQSAPQRPHTTATPNVLNGPRPINIYPQHSFQYLPVQSTMTISRGQGSGVVPRLPPPPLPLRVNNTQRMGRLENQSRLNLNKSIADLRNLDNVPKEQDSIGMSPSFYDRRSLNQSVHDLREVGSVAFEHQQLKMMPINTNQNNRLSLQPEFTIPQKPLIQQPIKSSTLLIQPKQILNPAPTIPTTRQSNNEMSSLHDEMAQLRLELASMKDPMKEHEEWLQAQSAQMKELEELQKQLHSNMVNNRSSSNLFTPSSTPISTITPNAIAPQPSKSPTLTEVVAPTRDFRPPITSPKPNQKQITVNKSVLNIGHAVIQSNPEVVKDFAQDNNNNTRNRVEPTATLSVKRIKETVQPTDTSSNVRVKRISQIFEANAMKNEDINSRKNNAIERSGTIKKLSSDFLRSIQASEESKMSSNPSANISKSNSFKRTPLSKQDSLYLKPVNTQQTSMLSPTTSPSFSKPTILTNLPPLVSKPSVSPPSSMKPSLASSIPPSSPKPPVVPIRPPSSPIPPVIPIIPPSFSKPSVIASLPTSSPNPSVIPSVPPSSPKPLVIPSVPKLSTKPPVVPIIPPSSPKQSLIHNQASPPPKSSVVHNVSPSIPKQSMVPSVPPASTKPLMVPTVPSSSTIPPVITEPLSSTIIPPAVTQNRNYANDVGELEGSFSNETPQEFFHPSHFPTTIIATQTENHRYANIPDELEMYSSSVAETESNPLPHSKEFKDSYSYIPDEIELQHEISTSDSNAWTQVPPKEFTSNEQQPPFNALNTNIHEVVHEEPMDEQTVQKITLSPNPPSSPRLKPSNVLPQTIDSVTSSMQLQPPSQVQRPTTPPPLPPPTPSESTRGFPSIPLEGLTPPVARPVSLDIALLANSTKSSVSSLPGTPPSPSETISSNKSDLMEQIRQFKQSGKSLKRASSEWSESGTPTRVRKNSMHDALQTRFQAFCGTGSDSSESEEDQNFGYDEDWDD